MEPILTTAKNANMGEGENMMKYMTTFAVLNTSAWEIGDMERGWGDCLEGSKQRVLNDL